MNIGVVGSRSRATSTDSQSLFELLDKLISDSKLPYGDITLISGGCPRGADRFCERYAKENGVPIKIYYPKQGVDFTKAAHLRNSKIALESDILVAIVSEERRGGTENTIGHFIRKSPGATEPFLIDSGSLILL